METNIKLSSLLKDSDIITKEIMFEALVLCNQDNVWNTFVNIVNNYDCEADAIALGLECAYSRGRNIDLNEAQDLLEEFDIRLEDFLYSVKAKEVYNKLGDTVTIYRGCSQDEDFIMNPSWTFNREVAEFFAFRNGQTNTAVYSTQVDLIDIAALLLERNEDEVLVFDVKKSEVELVTDKPTDYYNNYINK